MSVFQFILQFSEVCLWVHQLYDVGTYLPFQLFPRGFFFSTEMRNIIRSRQRNLSQIVLIELTANEKEKRERRRWKDEAEEEKLSKGVVKTDTLFTRCTSLYCNKHSARLCNISNTSRGSQRVERGSRVGGGVWRVRKWEQVKWRTSQGWQKDEKSAETHTQTPTTHQSSCVAPPLYHRVEANWIGNGIKTINCNCYWVTRLLADWLTLPRTMTMIQLELGKRFDISKLVETRSISMKWQVQNLCVVGGCIDR